MSGESSHAQYTRGPILGRGAYKTVYRAIDRSKGTEVAWNEVRLEGDVNFEKLCAEITLLRQLKGEYFIGCYESWVDQESFSLIFISELMESGNLKSFIHEAKGVSIGVMKDYCSQILKGLLYIHTLNPPIIHRDIKLDNIFFHGPAGQVKIGDLGIATLIDPLKGQKPKTVCGTPEFMAPEFYSENYDEKVDIWAFGLCVLEMVTLEYPYEECGNNYINVFKVVTAGLKPRVLVKIKDDAILDFICRCLEKDKDKRPSAEQLFPDPFLVRTPGDTASFAQFRTAEEIEAIMTKIGTTEEGWNKFIAERTEPLKRVYQDSEIQEGVKQKLSQLAILKENNLLMSTESGVRKAPPQEEVLSNTSPSPQPSTPHSPRPENAQGKDEVLGSSDEKKKSLLLSSPLSSNIRPATPPMPIARGSPSKASIYNDENDEEDVILDDDTGESRETPKVPPQGDVSSQPTTQPLLTPEDGDEIIDDIEIPIQPTKTPTPATNPVPPRVGSSNELVTQTQQPTVSIRTSVPGTQSKFDLTDEDVLIEDEPLALKKEDQEISTLTTKQTTPESTQQQPQMQTNQMQPAQPTQPQQTQTSPNQTQSGAPPTATQPMTQQPPPTQTQPISFTQQQQAYSPHMTPNHSGIQSPAFVSPQPTPPMTHHLTPVSVHHPHQSMSGQPLHPGVHPHMISGYPGQLPILTPPNGQSISPAGYYTPPMTIPQQLPVFPGPVGLSGSPSIGMSPGNPLLQPIPVFTPIQTQPPQNGGNNGVPLASPSLNIHNPTDTVPKQEGSPENNNADIDDFLLKNLTHFQSSSRIPSDPSAQRTNSPVIPPVENKTYFFP